jgi:hypothetical protein
MFGGWGGRCGVYMVRLRPKLTRFFFLLYHKLSIYRTTLHVHLVAKGSGHGWILA